jgi:hypothetical protein
LSNKWGQTTGKHEVRTGYFVPKAVFRGLLHISCDADATFHAIAARVFYDILSPDPDED